MKITILEFILAAVLSVMLGVIATGWSIGVFLASLPILEPLGLQFIVSGVWLLAGLLVPLIIRKPGVALFSELGAITTHAFLNDLGVGLELIYFGFVEGIGAEAVFMFFKYKKWNFRTVLLAALSSAFFGFSLNYGFLDYADMGPKFNLVQLISFELSGALLGALPAWYMAKQLVKTGVFNGFRIVRDYDGFEAP